MKRKWLWFLPGGILILAVIALGLIQLNLSRAQETAHKVYIALTDRVNTATLTLTEQGQPLGIYTLEELGLLDEALTQLEKGFDPVSRMSPEEFHDLSVKERLFWQNQIHSCAVELNGSQADLSPVLSELSRLERTLPRNAYLTLTDGRYTVVPEESGDQFSLPQTINALRQALTCTLTDSITVELTELDVYRKPSITADSTFDVQAQFAKDVVSANIPVQILTNTYTLQAQELVSLQEDGSVTVDEKSLSQAVAQWAGEISPYPQSFVLDSQFLGPVPLHFLSCTYELRQEELLAQLTTQLKNLDSSPVKAPLTCTRNNEPFALGDTYVEVDIHSQKLTYIKDGEVLVQTDVTTGYPYGHWTPPGYYAVESISTDDWLIGPDYQVFVQYWVGFSGLYGIHDASWRSEFGGKLYQTNGSHGCVNTPTEPMKLLFDNISLGVPVVVFDC